MKQTNIVSTRLQGEGSHWGGTFQLDGKIRQARADQTYMLSGWKNQTLGQEMQAPLF